MDYKRSFFESLDKEMTVFNFEQSLKYPQEETLTIDLHCHDHNSDEPDELLGRILNIPETWLPSEELISTLEEHGCDTFTVTNHNNARSCYELQDKGMDVLTGAEFSCTVPDFNARIHVLAYGFSPAQEEKLYRYRSDIYRFQSFALEHNIPTIWAHPLYHYRKGEHLPMEFFDKMSLVFERFEVINGQRDTWQNLLVRHWIDSMTAEELARAEKKFKIKSPDFCSGSNRKVMCGGSDSHMGIFAGLTGTRLYVKDLRERLANKSRSELALESLREGNCAPFGGYNNNEKMTVTFIDYFAQIVTNMKDPGLLRLMLHKGSAQDKALAFFIINAFSEMQRHKLTVSFMKLFHDCLNGENPGFTKKLLVTKDYKDVFREADAMADTRKKNTDKMAQSFDMSIDRIFTLLYDLMFRRLNEKLDELKNSGRAPFRSIEDVIASLELPGHLRRLFEVEKRSRKNGITSFNAADFLDGLTFPFLASSVIAGANYASTRVLYKARPMLDEFSEKLGRLSYPKRMLWLTDTFDDTNGVSMFLGHMLNEIRRRNLPIDLLVCSSRIEPQDNLVVVRPSAGYTPPFYENQEIRIPNVMEVHKKFREGEYDRILCSTEGPMGLISILLKNAYSVPASFYVHTDWITFARDVLHFSEPAMNRVRRLLRAFYRSFDQVFVLNTEQKKWFSSEDIGFKKSAVRMSAHWVDEKFTRRKVTKRDVLGVDNNQPVLLFVGRISEEKGTNELPFIYSKIKEAVPEAQLVIAGKGPEEENLKQAMPDAKFLGWVEHDTLPSIYSAADMLILPSRFDTFGNVIIEAFSCGCPVVSYNTKGPRDIIINDECGYLVNTKEKMADAVIQFMKNPDKRQKLRDGALKRAAGFSADTIISNLLRDTGLEK